MARTYFVKHARKDQGNCAVCGTPIKKDDPYKWTKPNYRGKIKACPDCTIPLRMTSSSKMVAIYDAQAELSRAIVDAEPQDIAQELRSLADTVREVGQEYQDSADSQREYFPDSEVAEENEEKANNLDSWADELKSTADDIESLQSDLDDLQSELDNLDTESEDYDTEQERLEGEIEEKKGDAQSQAEEASNNCPV